jgi:hypothetical protein
MTLFWATNLTGHEVRLENASSLKDEAEGFEKSLLPHLIRDVAGEGLRPSPERISVLRQRNARASRIMRKDFYQKKEGLEIFPEPVFDTGKDATGRFL